MNCECSSEYGPCEQHGDTLVIRDGASQRTADQLAMGLVEDLLGFGVTLPDLAMTNYELLTGLLVDSSFEDPEDSEAASDLAREAEESTDLWVIHDDGYRIVRPHADCPLVTT